MTGRIRRHRGFTLMEVVIAMALSALVVMMAVGLYSTVQRAGTSIVSAQRVWIAQQFLRGQLANQDQTLNKTFNLVRFERDRLTFVTRKSALYGHDGPPVVAFYRIDHGELRYREVPLPPWWKLEDRESQFDLERLRGSPTAYEGALFAIPANGGFNRWDRDSRDWVERWTDESALPPLVRLTADLPLVMPTSSLNPRSRTQDDRKAK